MRYETGKVWKNSRELYFARKSFSINLNIRLTMNINVYKDLYMYWRYSTLYSISLSHFVWEGGERERIDVCTGWGSVGSSGRSSVKRLTSLKWFQDFFSFIFPFGEDEGKVSFSI